MIPIFISLLVSAGTSGAASATDANLRIILGSGGAQPVLAIARGNAAAKLCAGRGLPVSTVAGESLPLYPARGVYTVTKGTPFAAMPRRPRRRCDLTLLGEPLAASDGVGEKFSYRQCSILFRKPDGDLLIAPNRTPDRKDRLILSECIYRLAMYVEGYRGALSEPTNVLFEDASTSALLVGRAYVGSYAPTLPRFISLRCPRLEQLYYRDDLADALKVACATALEPLNLRR